MASRGYPGLKQPFRLATEDSGMNGHQVVYQAYAGEKPVMSGGISVTKWRKNEHGLWTAAVDLADCRQLFVDGRRAVRARGDCPEGVERFGAMEFIDADAGHVFPQGTGDMAHGASTVTSAGLLLILEHMICKVESITADEHGHAI